MNDLANSYAGPVPAPDPETKPFWDGMQEGRLMIQRCPNTGTYQFPPTTFCPGSLTTPEWVEASGRGKIFSWIVVRHPVPRDIFADKVPYVVALVELEEGCRMTGNLIGCDPEDVKADMAVEIAFNPVSPELTLPAFRPSAG
ncbi:hypothetical protein MB02_07455 [Croceicoccus estronivorus]|uniref:Zn-ribbon domain-containing OB-fold protein n=1 Tax=Croceicoccus estronivorus TaxID=1172626 RepID=UPI000829C5B5|nr:Zn-ribbon domain-containing OB-fold protein [Croceicoccus estronivorus]OCC24408.1 hypothetical protein MB02_07455 [Croceicoccus estronivorus]